MIAATSSSTRHPQTCWCGVWTVDGPCLYHGTDLAERAAHLLGDIALHHDDAELDDAAKWLAWVAIGGAPGRHLLGDLLVSYSPSCSVEFTAHERAALIGDAIAGRWPW